MLSFYGLILLHLLKHLLALLCVCLKCCHWICRDLSCGSKLVVVKEGDLKKTVGLYTSFVNPAKTHRDLFRF